jgi:hypothetical protein
MKRYIRFGGLASIMLVIMAGSRLLAEDKPEAKPDDASAHKIELAEGKLLLTSPESWKRKEPKFKMIEHEFAVPASKGDEEDGRVTVMGAGGDIDANVQRWINQFDQPDGSETKNLIPEAKRKEKIGDLEIQRVDLTGNYRDMRPFDPTAKPVVKEKYRMLAAIIVAPKLGSYFFKFYGPRQTVTDHAEEFWKMIDGVQKKP